MARKPFKRKRDSGEDPAVLRAEIDTVLRVLAQYPAGTRISFAAPVRCPVCANFGLVEHVEHGAGRSHNHCVSCGTDWVITLRGLRAAREVATAVFGPTTLTPTPAFEPDAAAPIGGVLFSRDRAGDVSRQLLNPAGQPREVEPLRWGAGDPVVARSPLRVLLVEDDQSDIEVVKALLDPVGDVIDLRWAKTRKDGEAAARTAEPDLVLLDLGLPDSRGLQTVTQWHFNSITAPVLVVSGEYGAEIVDRGRELGVTGFLDKAELADLLAAGDEGTSAFIDRLESAVTA